MTNNQYRNKFLLSKATECLTEAARLLSLPNAPATRAAQLYQLNAALAFARQLPATPKHRAIRAHIVSAIGALQ